MGDNNTFKNNVAHERGGSVYAENSTITLMGYNRFSSKDSTIFAFFGGGIAAINCTIIVKNETSFLNNAAYIGGAIYMINSRCELNGFTKFLNNSATSSGGAIYSIIQLITYMVK